MNNYKVAIIIPTLNEERFIAKCLDSIITQTFPFDEMVIMVVDGGSRDKTREIVTDFSSIYPNIRLIDNPNRIQSIAFNLGVKNSPAPFVVRLDAHALYDPKYIELCIKHLESNAELGNVGGRWIIESQNGSLIAKSNAILNQMKFAIGGAEFRVGNELKEVETVPFGAFRKEVIEKIGGMNPNLPRGEDNEYNTRIREAGFKILFDPNIIATYYARPTLKSFVEQMYNNGFSIGILYHMYKKSISVRHLIPFIFLVSIIFSIILGFFTKYGWYLLTCDLCLYFACGITASLKESHQFGWKYMLTLPWELFLIHVAYGYGTLIGLLKRHY